MNTHHETIKFGKHKGELWTRIPVSYLRWLANQTDGNSKAMAEAELERRGTVLDHNVEISSHAIDRASLRCRAIWHRHTENDTEKRGLYTWLLDTANEALELYEDQARAGEKVKHNGLKLVFEFGNYFPILKSVMPDKKPKEQT